MSSGDENANTGVRPSQRSRFLVLTNRSVVPGDENDAHAYANISAAQNSDIIMIMSISRKMKGIVGLMLMSGRPHWRRSFFFYAYKTKLIARLVLRQKSKIYWPIFQLAELVFFRTSTYSKKNQRL